MLASDKAHGSIDNNFPESIDINIWVLVTQVSVIPYEAQEIIYNILDIYLKSIFNLFHYFNLLISFEMRF